QGQFSWVHQWPIREWESFYMWPVPSELASVGVPPEKVIPLNCIHFLPHFDTPKTSAEIIYDICIISRPSPIKRTREMFEILRKLFAIRPNLRVVVIMPDPRKQKLG